MNAGKNSARRAFGSALIFLLGLAVLAGAQAQRQRPPEYDEIVAGSRIEETAARLKEFERIKSAYPDSQMAATIDMFILDAKVELSDTLERVLALQRGSLDGSQGPNLVSDLVQAAGRVLEHPKVKTFDGTAVVAAVLGYRDRAMKALEDPATLGQIPDPEQRKSFKSYYGNAFGVPVAQAHLVAGDTARALTALESHRNAGGAPDARYLYTLGEVSSALGKDKEAYEAFLGAAVENYDDAADRAKDLFVKTGGKAEAFAAVLEAKLKELPYHPEPFKAPSGWGGKAVLAELFTGSECPPCVGADLGFDGLIEAYPTKYLAILQYHLPIPGPDPMMNPATKLRQDYYGVNSTPTVFIDGTNKMVGGGSRGMAEGKFKQYRAAIDPLIVEAPEVTLKVQAFLGGDKVEFAYEFDKAVPGADYHIVLVQDEEDYKGANGLQFHKLVVRDLVTVDPAAAPKRAAFDLSASEKATDAYLTEFEKTYTRRPGFKWATRRAKIAREGLKVVFFAQDRESKRVLNAVVADVK
jgi:hypothetical protein